jgi:hypothetical protein
MPKLTDEEIRLKAVEISFYSCAIITGAAIQKVGLENLNEVAPFGSVKDIEKYVKTGEHPKPIKIVKTRKD